jgi:hypothetical protein
MVTGRDATLAGMSSAVFARSAFQHDDEPIGSLICPACVQIVARSELIPDRPRVERRRSAAPRGRSIPAPGDPATEVEALAALLAEVVELAGERAVFPGRWAQVAELAVGVRRAPGDRIVRPHRVRPVYDRWRDVVGTHIPDGCRVEQVEVDRDRGALRCRLHQRGVVIGLLRVRPPLSPEHIGRQLEQLRDPLPAGGDDGR